MLLYAKDSYDAVELILNFCMHVYFVFMQVYVCLYWKKSILLNVYDFKHFLKNVFKCFSLVGVYF